MYRRIKQEYYKYSVLSILFLLNNSYGAEENNIRELPFYLPESKEQAIADYELFVAITNQDYNTAQELLKNGADPDARYHSYPFSLHGWAQRLGRYTKNYKLMELTGYAREARSNLSLQKKLPVLSPGRVCFYEDNNNSIGLTLLHRAAMQHSVNTLTCLLKKYGAEMPINQADFFGETPLHKAIRSSVIGRDFPFFELRTHEVIKLLLDAGAQPYYKNISGTMPLYTIYNYGLYPAQEDLDTVERSMRLHPAYLNYLLQNSVIPAYRKKQLLQESDELIVSQVLNEKNFAVEKRCLSYKSDQEISYWVARRLAGLLLQSHKNSIGARFRIASIVGSYFLQKSLMRVKYIV